MGRIIDLLTSRRAQIAAVALAGLIFQDHLGLDLTPDQVESFVNVVMALVVSLALRDHPPVQPSPGRPNKESPFFDFDGPNN